MPDRTRYNLDYRPASYWTTAGDGAGVKPSVRRRPAFDLGREFLPEKQPNEVEIALISLASVTGDVIAITARRRAPASSTASWTNTTRASAGRPSRSGSPRMPRP